MSTEPHALDAKELFDLLLDMREFLELWQKARRGKVDKNEKEQLGRMVGRLAGELNVLPFRGRLLQYMLTRRPTLLPRWTGIPDAVDKVLNIVLEYLTYRYDHVVWEDIRSNPKAISEYINRNPDRREKANGFIFELIARRWLKEARGEHWSNVQRIQILTPPGLKPIGADEGRLRHGIEVDAFSVLKSHRQLNIAIAEIERSLTNSALVLEIVTKAIIIAEYFKKHLGKGVNYAEIALVGCRRLTQEEKDDLKRELKRSVAHYLPMNSVGYTEKHINVYDLEDMLKSTETLETDLANVIRYLGSIRC